MLFLAVMLVSCAAVGLLIFHSTQRFPDFYRTALQMDAHSSAVSGDEMEINVFELQNKLRHGGQWSAVFTQDQINGWLASDLPEKFPTALPPMVQEPRICLAKNQVHLAFQLQSERMKGVVTAAGEIFCTDIPNLVAIKIDFVKYGLLPIPIERWADQISEGFHKIGLHVTWTESEGAPVCLLKLPDQYGDIPENRFTVESIAVSKQKMQLAGQTRNQESFQESAERVITASLEQLSENQSIH